MKYTPSFITVPLSLFLLFICAGGYAEEGAPQEDILADFHPYRQGLPQVEGITPGMQIDQTNFQVAESVLPPEVLTYLQAGDFTISVRETTDMPLRQAYIQATLEHSAQVELGEGQLKNYVAGLPFPVVDPQDPTAGEKMAWNLRYRDQGDTREMWARDETRNSGGNAERTEVFYLAYKWGMHRPDPSRNVSKWEKEGVYSKMYSRVLAPADMEGMLLLFQIYDQDTTPNAQSIYDPGSRRVRTVADNPYEAFGEYLLEDLDGFMGYLHAYTWRYVGEQTVLVPGPIQAAEPTLGGKGKWYPQDPWELRQAIVVEATPKEEHPVYSRRVLYLDRQTSAPLYSLVYDPAGNHKRTFFLVYFHPKFKLWNNDGEIPAMAVQLAIDYEHERASIYQITKVLSNPPLKDKLFSRGTLLRRGK